MREGAALQGRPLSQNKSFAGGPGGAGTACFFSAGHTVCNLEMRLFGPARGAGGTAHTRGRVAPKKGPQKKGIIKVSAPIG